MRTSEGHLHVVILFLIFVFSLLAFISYTRINQADTELNPIVIKTKEVAKEPFSFTAAGDFDDNDQASATLTAIGNQKSNFTLALGDLGYVGNGNEAKWCDFVHERVGTDHPFQIVAGNHDDGGKDGDITEYAKCLPNKLPDVSGEYGLEYFFDYNNLARFIMISPDIDTYGFSYKNGSEHMNWLVDKINGARAKKLDWVVVGMHKNCITPGEKTCEIGDELLNKLVDMKVDIILQGHEHSYFRSKQLALNEDTCPAIIINSFNESCITGSGDSLPKGEGSIIVISGAAGRILRNLNFDDPEFNYFDSVNGRNSGKSYGYSSFDVAESKITAKFKAVTGNFSDLFEISK
jgi:hypothetical protein